MRTIKEIKYEFRSQKAPYVWQLKLTPEEYATLKSIALSSQSKEDFILQMIFVGEWYKREYDGTVGIKDYLPGLDSKKIWEECGFRSYLRWVSDSERGKEWTYSLYVLGGFSSKLECGHPKDPLLEQLCCLYHGEEIDLTAKDRRAIPLAQSIENEGSIFHFIQEIITGSIPYSNEDISNPKGEIFKLIELIKTANKKALKEKFNCEWLINYAKFYETMSRRLKVSLRPERGNSGLKQYLSYERLENWGFKNPETISRIKISLRYSDNKEIVKPENFDDPLLIYSNSGNDGNGFISWNAINQALASDIPTRFFNKVDIVVEIQRTDFLKEIKDVASNANFPDYLQVYKIAKRPTEWSNRYRIAPSAVLYNSLCKVIFPPKAPIDTKRFYNIGKDEDQPKESEPYFWTPIDEKVTIRDSLGQTKDLYNRQFSFEVVFNKYEDCFSYLSDGKIKVEYQSSADSEWQEEMMPVLFGDKGYELRRFLGEGDEYEKIEAEEILYNGDKSTPEYEGIIDLKIKFSGLERKFKVWYIPVPADTKPVTRDFANRKIVWYDGATNIVNEDKIRIEFVRGNDKSKAYFTIFSPILGHEIKIDGKIVERIPLGHDIEIPFLYAHHFAVTTIDKHGIKEISGKELKDLYYQAPLQTEGNVIQTKEVRQDHLVMYLYDLRKKPDKTITVKGYVLPDISTIYPRHYGKIEIPKITPFSKDKGINTLEAFKIGKDYKTYYLILDSIRKSVRNGTLIQDLINPLLEEGVMTREIIEELWRLAFEFHFDWMLLPREQWEHIASTNRDFVKLIFLHHPKAFERDINFIEEFSEKYWNFKDFSTTDPIAAKALKMILGTYTEKDPRQFMKEFVGSHTIFHEMTKIF